MALLPFAVIAPVSDALAQQKQHVSFKIPAENIKLTQHNVEVGDVPNHVVNVYDAHFTFPNDAPAINGLKLAEGWNRGTGDLTDGYGTATGYQLYVMENGDRFFVRAANVTQTGTGAMLTATVVGHITGGTGKLSGIQGIARSVTNFDLKEHTGGTQTDIEYSIGK